MQAVIAVTDKADGRPFDDRDLAILMAFGAPASLALGREESARAHARSRPPGDGGRADRLFNRRYFETRLEQEIQRQRRQFDELSLLMVDLDNFKDLNDSQGHLVGDRVLREVADILRRAVRIFDVCARYGGEEFVILMPGANAATALRIAERIRRQVEQHFASGLRAGSARVPDGQRRRLQRPAGDHAGDPDRAGGFGPIPGERRGAKTWSACILDKGEHRL